MSCYWFYSLLLGVAFVTGPAYGQGTVSGATITLEDVVKMAQNGLSEDLIITRIKKSGKAFDLSTDELVALKNAGVKELVVKYLLDPSQPYNPAPPSPPRPDAATVTPKADAVIRKFPEDRFASKVPPESGLYRFDEDQPEKIPIKMLLGESDGPGLGKVLLKKGHVTAYLVGPAAKVQVAEASPVFYIRLPEGKSIEELLLLSLQRKNGRRDIDMGPAAPKPEFRPETMKPFDSLEVGPGVFRLTTSKLAASEYLFYLLGSAEPPKGNYGKGYDFGVDLKTPSKKR